MVELAGTATSLSGPVTITLSDGGAGGSVRGNPIVTTDHRKVVLNYRPPAGSDGDTITLSITSDDDSLTDPAPITYTVSGEAPTATGYGLTGPSAGPLDAESAPFTLALAPAGATLPTDFDDLGCVAHVQPWDSLTNYPNPFNFGTAAMKLVGVAGRYADRQALTDDLPPVAFTYQAWTPASAIPGPYPGTTTLSAALAFFEPAIWSAPPGLTYTAPAPASGGRLRIRTAAGTLRLLVGGQG